MKRRSAFRRLRKSVRRVFITKPFMWIGVRVAPAMYMAYMRFVWASSRVDDGGAVERFDIVQQYGGLVGMFWHEEVIASPYAYHRFGIHPHTLINMSDVGELITRIAERCHFIVFRGGSSSRRSRRRSRVFRDMIDHM
ncbi:MAG: hypothetical protein OEM49_13900, partial [Myxococcales bacterium]|nr:hypothetical protein [Myxococcales bacterium]